MKGEHLIRVDAIILDGEELWLCILIKSMHDQIDLRLSFEAYADDWDRRQLRRGS